MFLWTIRTIQVFNKMFTLSCKFPSITTFFGKSHFFKLSRKLIYFVEVNFQTGSLLKSSWLSLPLGLRRLFFQKLTCLDFLDMPIFESVILVRFGQNIDPGTQRYSQEALRRLSGYSQDTLGTIRGMAAVMPAGLTLGHLGNYASPPEPRQWEHCLGKKTPRGDRSKRTYE